MTIHIHAPARASLIASLLLTLAPCASAFAHAHLRSAEPPAGSTVHVSVQDIRISYSEEVEPRFCQVAISGSDSKPVEAAKPVVDPADAKVLIVHLAHPLAPGAYTVNWHATSTDTHKTQGHYGFTVAP